MKIGFIGAGRVGFSLGKLFSVNGICVTGYYSRHTQSAKEAAEFTETRYYTNVNTLVSDSDAIFITVPDGQISEVYNELRKTDINGKQLCHCSGAMTSLEAFCDIDNTGASGYSIHPLFPVSDKYHSYREMSDVFFCIEGAREGIHRWKCMLENIGIKVKIIDSDVKAKYHTACAISSNLVCALLYESIRMLSECGFDEEEALTAIRPLAVSNIEHILNDGPVNALTGPLERGDTDTIKKHIECMGKDREIYKVVSEKLLEMAKIKNPYRDYAGISSLLKED